MRRLSDAYPVYAMCPPEYISIAVANNIWMEQNTEPLDKQLFFTQWLNLYNAIADKAMVYLMPPKRGLQDQVYMNCAVYLPHNDIVLANWTAEGRTGEEDEAEEFFDKLGFNVSNCPFRFEGEAELKRLRDGLYLGGYGFQTDIRALNWIEEEYGIKIIKIQEKDEKLYHLDCSVFVMDDYNIIAFIDDWDDETLSEVEGVCNIHKVSRSDAWLGICNSLLLDNCIYNSSSLIMMNPGEEFYQEEIDKNTRLEEIASSMNLGVKYFDLSELMKSGALLSCTIMKINNFYG